jgi:tRNA A-37 threonylcarbamoyl transferase component Bud32/tetratricopeptide (TPR) repeat protein
MTRERWQRIQDLFYSAADLPPARRADYLHDACAGDESLIRQVEDLIASEHEAEGFLDVTLRETASTMVGAQTGERIGPYRITGELGRGGMGDVYLAERDDEQFHKQVAIKLIRSDAAPERLLARFRAERQILAALEHPNIARLLDGGAAAGSPYLVMEYVAGQPIDRYCTERALSIRDRLRLFRSVCEAVAYAHRSLIIHRDIKPSNILVAADGVPKLLDFGIAKLIKEDAPADGLTRPLERAMTPAYASPEVVRGEHVTTAADVYSLGALLYELLTERAPFHLTSSQAAEVERVVCMQEPPKPGTLDRRLRGDLENIIGMAMHKEAARRYASVEQLIADIDRYLTGYPVAARSDRLYRWGKFARRNRAALAGVVVAAAGIAGWVISLKAEQARTRAGFAQVRELAESLLFQTDDALRPIGGATAAREVLVRRGLTYLDGLARQAGNDVRLQDELADAYQRVAEIQYTAIPNLGQPAGALESCRKAVAIRQALVAAHPSNTLLQRKLAQLYLKLSFAQQGVGDQAGSSESFRAASAVLDGIGRAMPDDLGVHMDLAMLYGEESQRQMARRNLDAARPLAEKSQTEARWVLAKRPTERNARRRIVDGNIVVLRAIVEAHSAIPPDAHAAALDRYREAESILAQLAKELPDDSGQREMQVGLYIQGCSLNGLLEGEQKTTACRTAAVLADQVANADPANVPARHSAIGAHHNLARRMLEEHDNGAMAEMRRAVEMADQFFADRPDLPESRSTDALAHQGYADMLLRAGDPGGALDQLHRSERLRQPMLLDPNNQRAYHDQARTLAMIGDVEMHQGNCREAMGAFDAALKITRDPREADHLRQIMSQCVGNR